MIWSRAAAANLPLRMATDAKLVPWPAPEDGCECSHRSSASDPGRPSPAASKLHSRASEERASSAPALWSVAFSTPAVPTGRVSRFGHSGVGPARAGFGIIGNDHWLDLEPSDTSGAPLLKPDPTARPYAGQAGGRTSDRRPLRNVKSSNRIVLSFIPPHTYHAPTMGPSVLCTGA